MIWWKVATWGDPKISPIEIISSTAEYVTLNRAYAPGTRREKKGREWFSTFAEARNFLLDLYTSEKTTALRKAEFAQLKWETVAAMTEPGLPPASDLDSVSQEEKVREETGGKQ